MITSKAHPVNAKMPPAFGSALCDLHKNERRNLNMHDGLRWERYRLPITPSSESLMFYSSLLGHLHLNTHFVCMKNLI
jgi:hypothetical protein